MVSLADAILFLVPRQDLVYCCSRQFTRSDPLFCARHLSFSTTNFTRYLCRLWDLGWFPCLGMSLFVWSRMLSGYETHFQPALHHVLKLKISTGRCNRKLSINMRTVLSEHCKKLHIYGQIMFSQIMFFFCAMYKTHVVHYTRKRTALKLKLELKTILTDLFFSSRIMFL